MIPLSVLDLIPVREGGTVAEALAETAMLAQAAEAAGYHRFWVAEHHAMDGIAGGATSVALAHIGHATTTIRIGAGGIMLPNHNPWVIAEQFGTLDALFPGRIDLGLGRAPGADGRIAQALRKDLVRASEMFPQDVVELRAHFTGEPALAIAPTPGRGAAVELWILGSSLFGAQLAAALGLPYAFASHFAPEQLTQALELYRAQFRPSPFLDKPHVMLGINVVAANTDAEAQYLFTSLQQAFVNLRTGNPGPLPPPIADMSSYFTDPRIEAMLKSVLSLAQVGSPETVKAGVEAFIAQHRPDELMVTGQIYDHAARLRSYEILSKV